MDFSKFISLDSDSVADTNEKLGSFSNRFSFISDLDRFKQQLEAIAINLDINRKDTEQMMFICEKSSKIKYLCPPLFLLGWCLSSGWEVKTIKNMTAKIAEMLQISLNEPSIVRYARFIEKVKTGNTFNFTILPNKIL